MSKLAKVEKLIEKGKEDGLLKLVEDRDEEVRLAAIAGLGKVGQEAGANALITLLHSPDAGTRRASAEALGNLGVSRAEAPLSHAMDIEKEPEVSKAMHDALANLKKHEM